MWFHLNGHIIGFRPQTQKLESPYETPSNTLAVKGLTVYFGKTTAQECKKTLDVRRSKTPLLVSSLLANFFPLSLVTVSEDFAKVNLTQFLSRF